jgi:hypothetical protein
MYIQQLINETYYIIYWYIIIMNNLEEEIKVIE